MAYSGTIYQRGYGLRGVFQRTFRQAVPIAKHLGKNILKRGVQEAIGLGFDKLRGKNMNQAVKERLLRLGTSTIRDVGALSSIKKKQGGAVGRPRGKKKNKGKVIKVKKKKKHVPSKPKVKGTQRGKGDIFS